MIRYKVKPEEGLMSNKVTFVKEPYSGNALKLKEELVNSIGGCLAYNKIYTHEKGFKWLLNSRGYIHMWIKKATYTTLNDERRTYYLIEHYRVTADGKLYEMGYSPYSNREAMEQDFGELQ